MQDVGRSEFVADFDESTDEEEEMDMEDRIVGPSKQKKMPQIKKTKRREEEDDSDTEELSSDSDSQTAQNTRANSKTLPKKRDDHRSGKKQQGGVKKKRAMEIEYEMEPSRLRAKH